MSMYKELEEFNSIVTETNDMFRENLNMLLNSTMDNFFNSIDANINNDMKLTRSGLLQLTIQVIKSIKETCEEFTPYEHPNGYINMARAFVDNRYAEEMSIDPSSHYDPDDDNEKEDESDNSEVH